jgi:hypothetical protein
MKICQACNCEFPHHLKIDGKWRSFSKRKFCLTCSPFGTKDKRHPKDRAKDLDGGRTCSKCKERKPLNAEHFCSSQSESSGFRWICKACASKQTTQKQKDQKQKCLEYKGSKCEICGYRKSSRSLHFHHTDPTQKDFTIAKYRMRSWESIKAELDKCQLVCANCHGEIHDSII